jgi:(R,R)-butanediol dehydrogenase/meso-butanediol dehydrogenase/diacetyl reductase
MVKIAVEWCGICGTDLHEYEAGPIFIPTADRPHPLTGGHSPLTLGHEYAGRIVEHQSERDDLNVDDLVAVEPLFYCRTCNSCLSGRYNLCRQFGAVGLMGDGGGFAEYAVVPDYMVHRLPDGMTTDVGALAEPVTVGWHAVVRSNLRAGETALVVGAGPIGAGILLSLRAAGADFVAVSEREGARARLARELGADVVLDPADDVAGRLVDTTDGGVDVVFEAAGAQAAMETALASVRRGGRVVSVAVWEKRALIDCNALLAAEIALIGTQAYAREYPKVLNAIVADRMRGIERLVTGRVALAGAIQNGFERLLAHRDEHMKILVAPK